MNHKDNSLLFNNFPHKSEYKFCFNKPIRRGYSHNGNYYSSGMNAASVSKIINQRSSIARSWEAPVITRNNLQPCYSGISIKRTPLMQKKCPLYRGVRFIEIFSKIIWPQSKAIRFSTYFSSNGGAWFIVCSLYRDFTVFEISLWWIS